MDYEQETYDDYYDYIDTSDVLEQHPASYAPDGVLGPLAAENDDSSFRSGLGPIHNRQTASQYNQQNYDAYYDMEFEDHVYFPDSLHGLPQEEVANTRHWDELYQSKPVHQTQASRTNPKPNTTPAFTNSGIFDSGRVASGGIPSLVPTSRLPDVYRTLFRFGTFNAVQSACFAQVMQTDENMVVSAPTGSGKTVLFELAIVNLLMNRPNDNSKCVYISPTKALCAEKAREWSQKFETLGVKCCELTGDTVSYGKGAWSDARDATIIVTTPEKLDSLSRNWEDHQAVFSTIRLMCVDEVHTLGESRGSTLEACLSRMKIRADCRFILVSATVPNASDIADWIGSRNSSKPAVCLQFGEEYRPCKLTRHVYGYHRNNSNTFLFDKSLDGKLFNVLQQHCNRKPTLIFCATRKGVVAAAERIAKDFKDARSKNGHLPWTPIRQDWPFVQQSLQELAEVGVGVHHAGLSIEDRRLIEQRFLAGKLFVVVATSTLAVGVNLPCHTVIIKGVEMWDGSKTKEYPDLDIVQMMGRAGRPQFDKEGVAVILCDTQQRQKYLQLGASLSMLESSLHHSLPEHLNSEIVLGAITDVQTAHEWLKSTFLFKRIQLNPAYYGIAKTSPNQTWGSRFDDLVEEALLNLETNKLLDKSESGGVTATAFGNIASRSYVKQASMSLIIDLPESASKKDVLWALSQAAEFKDIRLRQGERSACNHLCQHPDIRFELKRVDKPHEKVFILLQAVLGGIPLSAHEYKNPDSVLAMEAVVVYKHATRLIRCFVEAAILRKAGGLLKHSLELHRSLVAKAWEDRAVVLRQLEGIGDKSIQVLSTQGITTIEKVCCAKPHQIETWLNRKSPFGKNLIAAAKAFPRCFIDVEQIDVKSSKDGKSPVNLSLKITCSVQLGDAASTKGKRTSLGMTSILTCTSGSQYIDYRRISTRAILGKERSFKVLAQLTKPSETVEVHMSPDDFAGVALSVSYKPNLKPNQFPIPDTRPKLQGNEEAVREYIQLDKPDDVNDLTAELRDRSSNHAVRVQNEDVDPAHEPLNNGHYACNHRCKDKTSCRHRCCQEGLAKTPNVTGVRNPTNPPKVEKSRTISKPKSSERQTKPKKQPKLQAGQNSFLKQLDSVHDQTARKAKLKDTSRLTMVSSNQLARAHVDSASDSDSLPDIDTIIRGSGKTNKVAQNEFDFSDEEMEAAMAALPSSTLVAGGPKRARDRGRSLDDSIEKPLKKRRTVDGKESKGMSISRDAPAPIDSEIIELDSSSESSYQMSEPRIIPKQQVDRTDPLHSPLNPRSTVTLSLGDLRHDKHGGSMVEQHGYDDTGINFDLDPGLFEGGEETLAAFASPQRGRESTQSISPWPAIPRIEMGRKQSIENGSRDVNVAEARDSMDQDEYRKESLFEILADQEAFERFFCDVEIE